MMHNNRRPGRAYTLIELLLVIGILAALSALVFGALAPAREKSREAGCISNLHQLGRAFDMYRSDYDRRDPAIGDRMTVSDLGLPPAGSFVEFWKQYKLYDSPVLFCPSYRPTIRDQSMHSKRLSSYIFQIGSDDFSERIAKRGNEYALALCNYHNPSIEFSELPTWTPFRCIVLRLSGQVSVGTRTAKDRNGFDW